MKTPKEWLSDMKERPCVTENDLLVIIEQIQQDARNGTQRVLTASGDLLEMASEIYDMVSRWDAGLEGLCLARAGLPPDERDAVREREEDARLRRGQQRAVLKIVNQYLGVTDTPSVARPALMPHSTGFDQNQTTTNHE